MTPSTDPESRPALTVGILTTERREELLKQTLASLERAADQYGVPVTVMLAGNEIGQMVRCLDTSYDLPISLVRTNGTLPDGRQRLIEACNTEWILFVDNDCIVEPDIFDAYATAIDEADARKVGAFYGFTRFAGDRTDAFDACRYTPYIHPFQVAQLYDRISWAPTANALFSTDAVCEVGGFSRDIPTVSGSDVDIGLRLTKAGYDSLAIRGAEITHTTETWASFWDNCRRFFNFGRTELWLTREYPERQSFTSRILAALGVGTATAFVGLVSVMFFGVLWLTKQLLAWRAEERPTSLQSYLIADIYRFVNFAGYCFQYANDDEASIRLLLYRFRFYERPYVQSRIRTYGLNWEND